MCTPADGKFDICFLGTGVSTAVPNLAHILAGGEAPCQVCEDAMHTAHSKNKRNNVSLAAVFNDSAGKKRCVVIDVGKTMRDACMSQLPKIGVSEVSGIVLTHGHADAIFGLDDVRDLQTCEAVQVTNAAGDTTTGFRVVSGALPVFLNTETMGTVNQCFSYLTGKPTFLDESLNILDRRIALLDFKVVASDSKFDACGLPVKAFPVLHGGSYVSLGFALGKEGQFVYLSDVKIIPEESMQYLKSLRIKTFVIDVLSQHGVFSHMGLDEALAVVAVLRPETVYFVGMSCSMGMHDAVEARLAKIAPTTHLAYDGLYLKDFEMH
ncbi:beta-lactamase-like protein [Ochromonadaceae sp. CCMP2298]|nr:beta-lactamase-like protein [Ochromonadaceae sp. CCMP2298]KAJ1439727.1 beta-lactamase-like protein [Ochromonadaceae sp. CCMP2298]